MCTQSSIQSSKTTGLGPWLSRSGMSADQPRAGGLFPSSGLVALAAWTGSSGGTTGATKATPAMHRSVGSCVQGAPPPRVKAIALELLLISVCASLSVA
jgi:hypothetical protein